MFEFYVNVADLVGFAEGGINLTKQGQEVYDSRHLMDVGVEMTNSTQSSFEFVARCLPSSNVKGQPHLIKKTNDIFEKWSANCSCKAGNSGKCKHIYARLCMFICEYICRITENKNIYNLLFSCFIIIYFLQYWGKAGKNVAKELYDGSHKISELPEYYLADKEYSVTQNEQKEIFQNFLSGKSSFLFFDIRYF